MFPICVFFKAASPHHDRKAMWIMPMSSHSCWAPYSCCTSHSLLPNLSRISILFLLFHMFWLFFHMEVHMKNQPQSKLPNTELEKSYLDWRASFSPCRKQSQAWMCSFCLKRLHQERTRLQKWTRCYLTAFPRSFGKFITGVETCWSERLCWRRPIIHVGDAAVFWSLKTWKRQIVHLKS